MNNYTNYNLAIQINDQYIAIANTLLKSFAVIKNTQPADVESKLLKGEDVLEFLDIQQIKELETMKVLSNKEINIEYLNNVMSNSSTLSATIVLGYKCNMKCTYCYEHELVDKPKDNIELEIDNIINFLTTYVSDNNLEGINLEFYGGEPIVYYQEMVKIAEQVSSKVSNFSFSIMTNGSLLNKEIVSDLKALGLKKIEVSLDGDESTHNIRRPLKNKKNSYVSIVENLKEITSLIPTVVRVNIDEGNYNSVNLLIEDLYSRGLRDDIYLYFTDVIKCKNQLCMISSEEIYRGIAKSYEKAQSLGFKVPFRIYSIGPCHFYRRNMYGIKPNGDICKCLALEDLNAGNINSPYIDEASTNYCKDYNCEYYPVCFGGCVYSLENKDINCPKEQLDIIISGFLKGKGLQNIN